MDKPKPSKSEKATAKKPSKSKIDKLDKSGVEEESNIKNFEELFKSIEARRFYDALGQEPDPMMIVLRAHLYIENLLERIILAKLPRGDKIVESGAFTFNQKLIMVDAIGGVPDNIISTVRGLNRLRNQCSHELGRNIQMSDITRVGSPLGKDFSRIKRQATFNERTTLREVLAFTAGYLTRICFEAEHE